mgnify:CR=1 FL=1
MDDLANFVNNLKFKKGIQNDRIETDFFNYQTNSLSDDKLSLKKKLFISTKKGKL